MPTYMFSLPPSAVGQTIQIRNSAGAVVDTATLTASHVDGSGNLVFETTQAEGTYFATGTRAPWTGTIAPVSVLDVPGSIAAGGGGGAAETAKFIGTATCDTSGASADMVFTQDPDGIVDWAEIDGDNIKLTGPLRFTFNARQGGTLDFSDATGFTMETTQANVEGFVKYLADTGNGLKSCWNDYIVPVDATGDVFPIDAPLASSSASAPISNTANHEATVSASVTAHGFDINGDAVTDGTYDAVFVVWINRTDLPPLPA